MATGQHSRHSIRGSRMRSWVEKEGVEDEEKVRNLRCLAKELCRDESWLDEVS